MTVDVKHEAQFRFVDLCAGVGGFHQAMASLGGECVGASEVNDACIETYRLNFPDTRVYGDISEMDASQLPDFDIVCAGFPCQPFSKAGKQLGFQDRTRGKLFFSILNVLDSHPEVKGFVFENVRNLADNKANWSVICDELRSRNFIITEDPLILSPSDFQIPQKRERVFILGVKASWRDERMLPNSKITAGDLDLRMGSCSKTAALEILDFGSDNEPYVVSDDVEEALLAWDEFRAETGIKTIGFPIWLSHFGIGISRDADFFEAMGMSAMPGWKQNYLRHNRHFYQMHRDYIDNWVARYRMLERNKLLQKFEWNCGADISDIKHGLIQIRQSGVRVKRPDLFPTLVAMPNTPIVWDANLGHFRRISPKEAAKLQSFDDTYMFGTSDNQTYRQLGNAVNVEIARQLGKGLLRLIREERNDAE